MNARVRKPIRIPPRGAAALVLLIAAAGAAWAGSRSPRDTRSAKPAERLDRPAGPRSAGPAAAASAIPAEGRAVVRPETELALEVIVPPGGVSDAWLGRFVDDPAGYRRADGRALPRAGETLRLPLESLTGAARARVLGELFPGSGPRGGDWFHPVGRGRVAAGQETIDRLARWYCGDPAHALEIAAANRLRSLVLEPGQELIIPGSLLVPGLAALAAPKATAGSDAAVAGSGTTPAAPPDDRRGAAPGESTGESGLPLLAPLTATPSGGTGAAGAAGVDPGGDAAAGGDAVTPEDDFEEAPSPEEGDEGAAPLSPGPPLTGPAPAAEGAGDLRYGRDAAGPFAIYRLKKGEALYTAVVVRFTGRVDVQEVNDLTARVAARSGITDVTGIPIGFPVKIALDDLLPEYLPRDDPRRQAWERSHAAVERYAETRGRRDLAGVVVILDAGHGGQDRGAAHHGVWEHDYVYDILCRAKALLETTTKARVMPTIKDRKEGYRIHDARRLPRSKSECLLTNPSCPLTQGVSNVNLRWYLANAWFRKLVAEGTDPDAVVFTSLHADARHPSLRGAMVYVPGAEYRRGRYGSAGPVYARYKEAREAPFVSFTREERERSEGLSRRFAGSLIDAFEAGGVDVHPYIPVRERIIRKRKSFVPAVLRCNIVPVQVLIEVANLSNRDDGRALTDPAYRQRIAQAYVDGLRRYFSGPKGPRPPAPPPATAAAGVTRKAGRD